MSSCAKFQNNSFVRCIVSSKNIKRTFLLLEPQPDVFSKNLFYGNQVSHGTSLYVKFQDHQPNSLGKEELHRNHRNRSITALAMITQLSYQK